MQVTAICLIDQYDPLTKLTKEGNKMLRYLFATEKGELFLLAFHLESLKLVHEFG
jgi:hypothetical protein